MTVSQRVRSLQINNSSLCVFEQVKLLNYQGVKGEEAETRAMEKMI